MSTATWALEPISSTTLRMFSCTRFSISCRSRRPKPSRVAPMVGRMVLASAGQFILAVASIMPQVKLRFSSCFSHWATLRMKGMKASTRPWLSSCMALLLGWRRRWA